MSAAGRSRDCVTGVRMMRELLKEERGMKGKFGQTTVKDFLQGGLD